MWLSVLGSWNVGYIYMNISDEMAANHSTFNNTICSAIFYHLRIPTIHCAPCLWCSIFYSISMLFLIRILSYSILPAGWKTSEIHFIMESTTINNVSQFDNDALYLKCWRIKWQISNFNKITTCWARIHAIFLFSYLKHLIHYSVSIYFNLWLSQVPSFQFNFLRIEYFRYCLSWSHLMVLLKELPELTKDAAACSMHETREESFLIRKVKLQTSAVRDGSILFLGWFPVVQTSIIQ